MPTPPAALTEDERLLLAGAGGSPIAGALARECDLEGLFLSHRYCSLSDEVVALRPNWRLLAAKVDRGALRLHIPDGRTGIAPVVVSRKRLRAYGEALPPEMRAELGDYRNHTRERTDLLLWEALQLPPRPTLPPPPPAWLPAVNRRHADAAGSSKTVTVGRVVNEHEYEPAETVALADKVADLREAWQAGKPFAGGQLFGLPPLDNDVWVDIAGASVITNLAPKTVTSFLSRGKPKSCPFPVPSKFLGRLYWPATVLLAWTTEYETVRRAERA
ncbi:hypothetical protein AB0J47_39970 [Nocardia sp. NPDC049737]|uniref:hypothetical protein n=1 Tax=Nocardia sp. NPDC049737 TaxID=3154358 RepID=UPI0034443678